MKWGQLFDLRTRVLIANIHNLGMCPCPWCLTPKNQIDDLGLKTRVDTEEQRSKVMAACCLIYQQHYVVDTPQVEVLLKEESLVPTEVLGFWYHLYLVLTVVFRTHFLRS